ncbi:hypothetical protein IM697_01800 [Streptomyces ferrugineus]|uniref:Uncharacterized protein n=1 Tax=Streptomyces ferrugineus TaxID=1413221 RepID=A0A7M2SLU9_9ACTN|nr:hypothetical protein [Streptomyces ferrugineus]QOV37224.1 hypothetical protein IM697_01800 [Streptomyces ferrugineus]
MTESRAKGVACAVLLVIGCLVAGAATGIAYLSNPLGPWDHQAFDHIRLFGRIGLAVALLTAPVAVLAVACRWLRPWRIVPCAVITMAAWGRLTVFFPAR